VYYVYTCQKLWKLDDSRQSYCKNYLAYFFLAHPVYILLFPLSIIIAVAWTLFLWAHRDLKFVLGILIPIPDCSSSRNNYLLFWLPQTWWAPSETYNAISVLTADQSSTVNDLIDFGTRKRVCDFLLVATLVLTFVPSRRYCKKREVWGLYPQCATSYW